MNATTGTVTFTEDNAHTVIGFGAVDELASMMNDYGFDIVSVETPADGAEVYTVSAETAATLRARLAARGSNLTWSRA